MLSNKNKQAIFFTHTSPGSGVEEEGISLLSTVANGCSQQRIPAGTTAEVTGTTTGSTSAAGHLPAKATLCPAQAKAVAFRAELEA